MNIGEAIKELRKKKGLSQTEFAQLCSLSQTSLSLIESGKTQPHENTINTIAEKLEVPPILLYFMTFSEKDVPERKKEAYRILGPAIKSLVNQLFSEELEQYA